MQENRETPKSGMAWATEQMLQVAMKDKNVIVLDIKGSSAVSTINPAEAFLTAELDDLAATLGISREAAALIQQTTEPGDTVLDVLTKLNATK